MNEQRICFYRGVLLHGQTCSSCGFSASSAPLTQSAFTSNEITHDENFPEQQWNEYFPDNTNVYDRIEDNEALDPLLSIPMGQTLNEVLLEQLETLVPAEDAPIAEHLY